MIDLMTQASGKHIVGYDPDLFAMYILPPNDHFAWPYDYFIEIRDAETSFLVCLFAFRRDDFRIAYCNQLRSVTPGGKVDCSNAKVKPNLIGGKSHSRSRIHGFNHVLGDFFKLAIEQISLFRFNLKIWSTIFENWQQHINI